MNRLIPVLAAVTLACAGLALYYRHELVETQARIAREETRALPEAPSPVVPSSSPRRTTSAPYPAARSAATGTDTSAMPGTAASMMERSRAPRPPTNVSQLYRRHVEWFLAKYDTPLGREELIEMAV